MINAKLPKNILLREGLSDYRKKDPAKYLKWQLSHQTKSYVYSQKNCFNARNSLVAANLQVTISSANVAL